MQLINSQPAPTEPHVVIVEQPASHKLRFRYECEGRGAGALQGATSTAEKKMFPKIQIRGYTGPAVVVVSCVTHDSDKPKAHPHMLVSPASVGRDGCKKGDCTQHVSSSDMTVEFQHLGIQCKRKRDIQKALEESKSIRVDPFRQGFEHSNSPGNIDLNAVRLCFQAFLENPETPGKFTRVVAPVCSKPVFDAKAKKELQIMDMSGNTAPAEGGKKLIILCERVSRDDIKVRFFQDSTGWEAYGEFKPEDVHKQYAISLTVPTYMDGNISENQQVWIELTKADGSTSEPSEFFYTPGGGAVPSSTAPKQVELSRRVETIPTTQSKPVNMYNGGSVTSIKSERKIKVERAEAETSWAAMVNGVNHPGSEACRCTLLHGGADKWWRPGSWEQRPVHFSTKQLRVCRPESGFGSTRLRAALWVALLRQLSVVLRQQHAAAVPRPARPGQHEHRQPNRDPESGPNNRVNLGNGAWRGGEHVAGAERPDSV